MECINIASLSVTKKVYYQVEELVCMTILQDLIDVKAPRRHKLAVHILSKTSM